MKTMTFRDLFTKLTELAGKAEATPDMEVIVRVQNDDGETMVGGLFAIDIDPGCTEIDALVLDGSTVYGVGETD